MKRCFHRLILASGLLFATAALAETGDEETPVDGASPAAVETVEEETVGEELSSSEFNRRLLTTEEEVNDLKEGVFRMKTMLQLLKEIVIQGSTSGSRALIWHQNELGPSFTIQSMNYYLDGQSIYAKTEESSDSADQFKIHDGPIPAGNHTVSISMVLRGNGFGIFSYVDQYTFSVQSSYAFAAEDGKSCEVWIRIKERKGLGRSFVERPWVQYDVSCTRVGQAD